MTPEEKLLHKEIAQLRVENYSLNVRMKSANHVLFSRQDFRANIAQQLWNRGLFLDSDDKIKESRYGKEEN